MKKWLSLLLAAVILLALSACGSTSAQTDGGNESVAQAEGTQEAAADVGAAAEGKRVLRVGCMESGGGYCPWGDDQSMIGNYLVYDRLVERSLDGTLMPSCCESFEWTDDTTLEIKMRDDVYFADGDLMTGEDVIFSFYQVSQGILASDFASLSFEDSYVSDDGMTVTFKFTEPYGPFESLLDVAQIANRSASEALASDEPGWWSTPQGSGPYSVVENVAGSHATYALRDNYWDDTFVPQWDEIIVNYYSEPTAMFIAFENGELDLVCSVSANDAARLASGSTALGDKAAYEFLTDNSVYCLNLNNYRPELQDTKVREAIAHAIDVDGLGQVAFGLLYKVADSQLSEATKYHVSVGGYEYDLDYAKQCMAESSYPDGFALDVIAMTGAATTSMWEVIQGSLAQIGITMNFQSYDMGSCLTLWRNESGNDLFFMSVFNGNSQLEPTKSIGQTKSTTPYPAAVILDDEYQQHLHDATYNSDEDSREQEVIWLQNWLHDNFQCIPLVENLACYAYNKDTVKGCDFFNGSSPNMRYCYAN